MFITIAVYGIASSDKVSSHLDGAFAPAMDLSVK